jgi:asparagine synthase (glutamine-hydrolysing)
LFDAARGSDEREFMAPAVEMGGLEHHQLVVDPASPLTDLERLLELSGEPYSHMALSLQHQANCAARAAGVRVLLDGNYGDAVVSHGTGRVAELLRAGRLGAAWREFAGLAGRWRPNRTSAIATMAWTTAIKPLLPEFVRQAARSARRLRQPDRPFWAANTPVNPALAWRLDRDAALHAHIETRARRFRDTRAENRFSLAKLPAMPELYNRIAAGPGLDLRHPYLDRRLVEFCLGLPAEQRLRDGWNRLIQRNAMRGILPEAVRQRRSKSSPIFGISRALLAGDMPRLAELMQQVEISAPYVDLAVAQADYAQLQQAAALGEYAVPRHWNPMLRLSRVLTLSLWLALPGVAAFDTTAAPA